MQIGKAHFELVDYLEADQAFCLARRVSPYSLEGMDVYSTVLFVSSLDPLKFVSLEILLLYYSGCPLSDSAHEGFRGSKVFSFKLSLLMAVFIFLAAFKGRYEVELLSPRTDIN